MLYWIAKLLSVHHTSFHVFSYLTLRAILAVMSALSMALLVGPTMIARLSRYQIGQVVRDDGPRSHLPKAGTPTMGGALKLVVGNSRGLSARWKYFWQSVLGLGAALLLFRTAHVPAETDFFVPFIKTVSVPLGEAGFIALAYFMIVGMSNAVNLTDGLDGLAIMPAAMVAGALGIFAYASGNSIFANYLAIPAIPQAGELLIFCSALAGAGLGFLWFNSYPAQVFMGDIGALALGAALGVVAIIVRQEIVALVMGGIFVLETASVILQVASFKLTGRRIFRMAPIHHHFELKGWAEPKVIVRFWIISFLLVLAGLSTLKLR